ncbi:MAG: hypothetical protein IT406_02285 [Candidatus Yanofskybacteria bacterium]|nr:hypothetical protein [Candidatus Yanofskybacteria bacterium]
MPGEVSPQTPTNIVPPPPQNGGGTPKPVDGVGVGGAIETSVNIAERRKVKRDIRETRRVYDIAAASGATTRTRGARTAGAVLSSPDLPQEVRGLAERLRSLISDNKRKSEDRTKEFDAIRRSIKRSFIGITGLALYIAISADILSIFDAGWIISWAIPIVLFFVARRIGAINKGAERAQKAYAATLRELQLINQRLGTIPGQQQRPVLAGLTEQLQGKVGQYMTRFVLETAGIQGFELIPILDWLPAYTGGVVKVAIDQYNAYQKAQRMLPPLQEAFARLEQLETEEVAALEAQLSEALALYQPEFTERFYVSEEAPRIMDITRPSTRPLEAPLLVPEPAL